MIIALNERLSEYHDRFPVFGIILFTDAHPHVVKALKDPDYYAALEQITGEHIGVFATMLFQGEYKYPQPPPGTVGMIIPVWKEPSRNREVLSWFGISDSQKLPLFVLFGLDNKELYYKTHPIEANSAKEVFNSLNIVLHPISVHIADNKDLHRRQLFKQLKWRLAGLRARQKGEELFRAASLLRGVSGL